MTFKLRYIAYIYFVGVIVIAFTCFFILPLFGVK